YCAQDEGVGEARITTKGGHGDSPACQRRSEINWTGGYPLYLQTLGCYTTEYTCGCTALFISDLRQQTQPPSGPIMLCKQAADKIRSCQIEAIRYVRDIELARIMQKLPCSTLWLI